MDRGGYRSGGRGGLYVEAVAATVIILIILAGIKPIEERFQTRGKSHEIRLTTASGAMSTAALDAALGYRARRITRFVSEAAENGLDSVTLTLTRLSPRDIEEIMAILKQTPGVQSVAEG